MAIGACWDKRQVKQGMGTSGPRGMAGLVAAQAAVREDEHQQGGTSRMDETSRAGWRYDQWGWTASGAGQAAGGWLQRAGYCGTSGGEDEC